MKGWAMNTIEDGEKGIKQAWIAGVISGSITLLVVILSVAGLDLGFSVFALIDVALIFLLSFGIYKKNRIAAVLLLAYYLINQAIRIAGGNTGGIGMMAIFTYFFIQGVRGTFLYHKLKDAPVESVEPVETV
ncbi:MAG TPA: hypothetical protein EYH05_17025 [Anaerolineae bacterium]|nr:hypothetical protein [Anaerolineae bacterium]